MVDLEKENLELKKCLKQALDYVEACVAFKEGGTSPESEKRGRDHVKRISKIGTARHSADIGYTFNLEKARELTKGIIVDYVQEGI